MAALLALETTAELCSVAIGNSELVLEDTRLASRLHNEIVLSMVDVVLSASAIDRDEVACVAFSAGPGSFTGVRIGAGIAQGIALAWDIPVCPVETSRAMALSSLEQDRQLIEFTTSRRSRRSLVYVAEYDARSGNVIRTSKDRLIDENDLRVRHRIVGDSQVALSARYVLEIAQREVGSWLHAEQGLPIYVEGDTPWRAATLQ
ncbi:MAG: tRNA (adenosine(37)-N6)-threonylcarbamoyltransferase complex dimerization subunit type 1 TsaB [Pseudomonadota bacterium]|nr:tRNA (adenosine(37)-N6)-threonylcarbamoyltransferase complex dimerization subunit type 1 TsaB [Pseudomonadota bacterium]